MSGSSRTELILSKPPRVNGWSWPLQPFQVLAWVLYAYLAVVSLGIYIPLLPAPWNHLVCAVSFSVELRLAGSCKTGVYTQVLFVFLLKTRILLCALSVPAVVLLHKPALCVRPLIGPETQSLVVLAQVDRCAASALVHLTYSFIQLSLPHRNRFLFLLLGFSSVVFLEPSRAADCCGFYRALFHPYRCSDYRPS